MQCKNLLCLIASLCIFHHPLLYLLSTTRRQLPCDVDFLFHLFQIFLQPNIQISHCSKLFAGDSLQCHFAGIKENCDEKLIPEHVHLVCVEMRILCRVLVAVLINCPNNEEPI